MLFCCHFIYNSLLSPPTTLTCLLQRVSSFADVLHLSMWRISARQIPKPLYRNMFLIELFLEEVKQPSMIVASISFWSSLTEFIMKVSVAGLCLMTEMCSTSWYFSFMFVEMLVIPVMHLSRELFCSTQMQNDLLCHSCYPVFCIFYVVVWFITTTISSSFWFLFWRVIYILSFEFVLNVRGLVLFERDGWSQNAVSMDSA